LSIIFIQCCPAGYTDHSSYPGGGALLFVLAFFLLGETLDLSLVTGGGMVIGGAYLTNRNW
jgi:drug/metabolite transporter (DMT)-like permease